MLSFHCWKIVEMWNPNYPNISNIIHTSIIQYHPLVNPYIISFLIQSYHPLSSLLAFAFDYVFVSINHTSTELHCCIKTCVHGKEDSSCCREYAPYEWYQISAGACSLWLRNQLIECSLTYFGGFMNLECVFRTGLFFRHLSFALFHYYVGWRDIIMQVNKRYLLCRVAIAYSELSGIIKSELSVHTAANFFQIICSIRVTPTMTFRTASTTTVRATYGYKKKTRFTLFSW